MAKFVVDIDEELMAEAAQLLGTSTKVATIRAALLAEVGRVKRRRFFEMIDNGELDLSHDYRDEAQPPRAAQGAA